MSDHKELYVDGGARGNPGPAACAYILKEPNGATIESEGIFLGETTNNVAEYTGLLKGLQSAKKHNIKILHIFSDSELMVKQIIGEYRVKSENLLKLYQQIQRLLLSLDRWQIRHIKREFNSEADQLVNKVLDSKAGQSQQQQQAINKPQPAPTHTSGSSAKSNIPKILVEVTKAPEEGTCNAKLQQGMCFVFTSVVPAGFCLYAAQSVLPTVLAMQRDLSPGSPPIQIRCSNSECGAVFKLTKI